MPLEYWILLWKGVLIGGIGLFAALAIVVTIGGALDIGRLFKTLREEHARATAENAEGSDAPGSRRS
ncbi:MAG: hypothetical protein RBS80_02195 [Thermoguttaceae bacterium]|jgi:hypothetical protein|nr:hypothetical protein [Thermoguttaceae bacterium]